jgi:L-malate glycosyltransferase
MLRTRPGTLERGPESRTLLPMNPLYSIHLSTAKTWRGGENQILILARGLLARGQKVLVVAPPDSPLIERCAEQKVPHKALKIRSEVDPVGLLRLMRLLRRERPAILHLHDGHAVLPGQLAARTLPRARTKVVAHRRTVFRLRGKWKYSGRIDRVVAISEAAKQALMDGGLSAENIRVVYSGLEFKPNDAASGVALRKQLGIAPEDCLIVHAAALTREKRHEDMLHSVALMKARVKEKDGPNVHLALAGTGPEDHNLRELAQSLGLRDCVHFLGFLRDVSPVWAAGTLACYTSEAEGLCTALVEAQAAGLPAVITAAGGMTEVVADGVTGRIVPVGDRAALAGALAEFACDRALCRTSGAAAADRARRYFSADVMVEGIARVYEELS